MIRRLIGKLPSGTKQLLIVFLVALSLRLAFMLAMTGQIEPNQMVTIDRDAQNYYNAALSISKNFDFQTYGVLLFGPGYPAILALWGAMLGTSPIVLTIMQILVSAIGAVLFAIFARKLTGDKRVGMIAGLINAVSIASITLANIMFSETVFFVLILAGFIAFLHGLDREKWHYFVISSILFGAAALTRSQGQFLFGILILINAGFAGRTKGSNLSAWAAKMKWSLVSAMLILIIVGSWIAWNYQSYGIGYLAMAEPGGMAHLVRQVVAERNGLTFGEAYDQFTWGVKMREGVESYDEVDFSRYRPYYPVTSVSDSATIAYHQAFADHTKDAMHQLLSEYPWGTAKVFLDNVRHNIHTEWGKQYYYLPNWEGTLRAITSWTDKKGLNYRVSLLSLIGVIMLLRQRKYQLLCVLLGIYAYFAFLSGFTIYQGSRVFYPGQIAWGILISYPLLSLYDLTRRKLKPFRLGKT